MRKNKFNLSKIIDTSWFFPLIVFIGFLLSGHVTSFKDLLSLFTFCMILWGVDALFMRKLIKDVLTEVKNWYQNR